MHPFFWVLVVWSAGIVAIWPIGYYAEGPVRSLWARWRLWRRRRAVLRRARRAA